MTRSQAASQHARFRQRKLNPKAPLEIVREDQVDVDNEPQNIPKLATGVEEAEEIVSCPFRVLLSAVNLVKKNCDR
jgi:hypothetical protein